MTRPAEMRCNRCGGKRTVRRIVFIPPEAGWPPGATETVDAPCPDCAGDVAHASPETEPGR